MPTYLYECKDHGEFEEYHSISHLIEECPKCQAEGKEVVQKVKRLICGTSKGIVELTGQDLVDKVKADAKQLQKDAAKNENIYANVLGESHYHNLQTKMDRRRR
jgi:putative FmdB family regulatory protein